MKISHGIREGLIIKNPGSFLEIYRKGKLLKGKRINIYYLEADEFRIGFSTARILRKAVERNRARRIMKEVFRAHQDKINQGFIYVFAWMGDLGKAVYSDAETEITDLLKKEGLIRQ